MVSIGRSTRKLTVRVLGLMALFSLAVPASLADIFVVTGGEVRLSSCFGANADFSTLTQQEDQELLFANDDIAVLTSGGRGRAGVTYIPEYGRDELPINESNFSAVDFSFKADDEGVKNTRLRLCFEGAMKSVPLSQFQSRFDSIGLGWRRLIISSRMLGLGDQSGELAPRLDRFSVALEGDGNISVGNVVVRFGPPDRPGQKTKNGESLPDTLITRLERCRFLNTCPLPLRRLGRLR